MKRLTRSIGLLLALAGLSAGAQENGAGQSAAQKPDAPAAAPQTAPSKEPGAAPAPAQAESRRKALQILAEAEAAVEAGNSDRALTLAREAQRLYPQSKAIAGFMASIQAGSSPARSASPVQNRAKAHLAAALTRAQVLMQQRRYTESLDLLNGIVEASKLFPASADVSLYRDLAQKELLEYRIGVQTGRIRPANETVSAKPAETPAAAPAEPSAPASPPSLADFPLGPANAYRLAKLAREQTPAWYTRHKTALARLMSVDYRNMPLGLVLDDIQQASGVAVIIDAPVQSARTTTLSTVDFRANAVSAETILSIACQLAGCEYVLLEKGIIVTTVDKAGDYIRQLPDSVATHWARGRQLFPDLYLEVVAARPLPGIGPGDQDPSTTGPVPTFLRSGRDLVADIQGLLR
jgi:hypothetical protein